MWDPICTVSLKRMCTTSFAMACIVCITWNWSSVRIRKANTNSWLIYQFTHWKLMICGLKTIESTWRKVESKICLKSIRQAEHCKCRNKRYNVPATCCCVRWRSSVVTSYCSSIKYTRTETISRKQNCWRKLQMCHICSLRVQRTLYY